MRDPEGRRSSDQNYMRRVTVPWHRMEAAMKAGRCPSYRLGSFASFSTSTWQVGVSSSWQWKALLDDGTRCNDGPAPSIDGKRAPTSVNGMNIEASLPQRLDAQIFKLCPSTVGAYIERTLKQEPQHFRVFGGLTHKIYTPGFRVSGLAASYASACLKPLCSHNSVEDARIDGRI